MVESINSLFISADDTIRQAVACIDRNPQSIALVVDETNHLIGTITDGDVRRAMLAGIDLESSVSKLLERKASTAYRKPITAPAGTPVEALIQTMKKYWIRQIPVLDQSGKVVDLRTLDELLPSGELPVQAVVMAGGPSKRLHPLVDDLPKPMLPVGNRPLLEWAIDRLQLAGIRRINLTTHYKPEIISDHFGDGQDFGVEIQYITENRPYGTAGALSLLKNQSEPILVMNGDILTNVDFRAMLDFHIEQRADLTVAVRSHEFSIPYGVLDIDGIEITGISEKPSVKRFINAGIYLLNPDLLQLIPKNQSYDMPDLINYMVEQGHRVISFPVREYWLDIEKYKDYQQAQADVKNGVINEVSTTVLQFETGSPVPPGVIPLCVPEIRGNEWSYIKECLDTNWVSSVGPFVDSFERTISNFVGTRRGVATSSGTSALHTAMLVAGIQPGDEVLVSTLTFIAPVNAIRYLNAWPIFIDADPDYWQMDPEKIEDFINRECKWSQGELRNRKTGRRVRAIIPVHILGHPCNMDPILEIARKYDLTVIEDATESLGARYKGKMVGHIGDIACLSFNGNKLITTGGGGMIITDNEIWADRAKYLTTQAKDDPVEFVHGTIGYNYRLTNIQAALGCAQMEQIIPYLEAKKKITFEYTEALKDIPGITLHREADWADSALWMPTILIDEELFGISSRELMIKLGEVKIQTRPLWQPAHLSPSQRDAYPIDCHVAERLQKMALSLPCSVGLSSSDQQRVIEEIIKIHLSMRENLSLQRSHL